MNCQLAGRPRPAIRLANRPELWENPTMTVVAVDKRKRVILKPAKPGDKFVVQVSEGKIVLTPVPMPAEPGRIKLVRKHGYTVAVGTKTITQDHVRKLMDEFP